MKKKELYERSLEKMKSFIDKEDKKYFFVQDFYPSDAYFLIGKIKSFKNLKIKSKNIFSPYQITEDKEFMVLYLVNFLYSKKIKNETLDNLLKSKSIDIISLENDPYFTALIENQ